MKVPAHSSPLKVSDTASPSSFALLQACKDGSQSAANHQLCLHKQCRSGMGCCAGVGGEYGWSTPQGRWELKGAMNSLRARLETTNYSTQHQCSLFTGREASAFQPHEHASTPSSCTYADPQTQTTALPQPKPESCIAPWPTRHTTTPNNCQQLLLEAVYFARNAHCRHVSQNLLCAYAVHMQPMLRLESKATGKPYECTQVSDMPCADDGLAQSM
jgi:hypothetical protein